MYEPFLDHARQSNDRLVKQLHLEKQIRVLKPRKRPLRDRLLFAISNLLLAAGRWIRPSEIQVYNEVETREVKIRPCNQMYAD
jgi:hypothetical protein